MWSGIFKWIDRVTDLCDWPLQKMPWHTVVLFVGHFKILHKHCLHFLSGVKMAPRETENIAYAKFWGNKQRTLWYVMEIPDHTQDRTFVCNVCRKGFYLSCTLWRHKNYPTPRKNAFKCVFTWRHGSQNNKTAAMMVYQDNPVELNSFLT